MQIQSNKIYKTHIIEIFFYQMYMNKRPVIIQITSNKYEQVNLMVNNKDSSWTKGVGSGLTEIKIYSDLKLSFS